eukprot:XP_025003216.1 nucleoporin-like protein 2 [Gallus gallus]
MFQHTTNTNIIQPAVFQHTAGGGGGSGAPAAVTQPPVIANSTSGGSGDGGGLSGASGFGPAGNNGAVLSQNAFSALSSAQPADGQRDGQQSLLDVIAEDMATWESSGQWMFSCYSPEKASLMFQALESSRLRRCVWSIITAVQTTTLATTSTLSIS